MIFQIYGKNDSYGYFVDFYHSYNGECRTSFYVDFQGLYISNNTYVGGVDEI